MTDEDPSQEADTEVMQSHESQGSNELETHPRVPQGVEPPEESSQHQEQAGQNHVSGDNITRDAFDLDFTSDRLFGDDAGQQTRAFKGGDVNDLGISNDGEGNASSLLPGLESYANSNASSGELQDLADLLDTSGGNGGLQQLQEQDHSANAGATQEPNFEDWLNSNDFDLDNLQGNNSELPSTTDFDDSWFQLEES